MKKFRSAFAVTLFTIVLFTLGLGMVWASGTGMTMLLQKVGLWYYPSVWPSLIVVAVVVPWGVLWSVGVARAYLWLASKPAFALIALPESR